MFIHLNRSIEPNGDDGQALVEYALIVSLVAVVCAGTLGALGLGVDALLGGIPGGL